MTQEEVLALMRSFPDKGMREITFMYTALVYKTVLGKLGGVCSQEDIEETVSDVFLDFYKNYQAVDLSKGSLTSFMIVLARRRAIDVFRKIMRQKNLENMPAEKKEDITDATENTVLENEERTVLFDSVMQLGEPDSTIIFRKFFFGETYEEIGNRLGLSANAVNKRYLRSIEKLNLMMKGEIFSD